MMEAVRNPRLALLTRAWNGLKLLSIISTTCLGMLLFQELFLDRYPPRADIMAVATPDTAGRPTFTRGSVVTGVYRLKVLRHCDLQVRPTLTSAVDEARYINLPAISIGAGDPPHDIARPLPYRTARAFVGITVPPDMPLGKAYYQEIAAFRCNLLGHRIAPVTVSYPSVEIEIVEGRSEVNGPTDLRKESVLPLRRAERARLFLELSLALGDRLTLD